LLQTPEVLNGRLVRAMLPFLGQWLVSRLHYLLLLSSLLDLIFNGREANSTESLSLHFILSLGKILEDLAFLLDVF